MTVNLFLLDLLGCKGKTRIFTMKSGFPPLTASREDELTKEKEARLKEQC